LAARIILVRRLREAGELVTRMGLGQLIVES